MEFLFAGDNQAPENQDPFEALSELCTFLAIADDGVAPLEPIGQRILEALQKSKMDGDVQVMASRALALLLDKFASSFLLFATKGKSSIADCLRHVFSQVTSHRSTLKFAKTTPSELTEELLRCLTLGTSSSAEVQAAMPSAELQLVFCEGSLDGAKWTSCKILRHCALLTRSGSVKQPSDRSRVHAMLHQHLTSLCVLDIDFEWDELLRAVTEGYLTLRAWSPGSDDITEGAAAAQAQANSTDSKKRHAAKRAKGADGKESCHTTTTTTASTSSVDQLYIDLAVRVCSSGMADSRKELVLACVNSVLLATSPIASDERRRALDHLVALLKETSEVTATITDPFVPKKSVTSDKDDGDSFKSLANLQWEVPALQWSALMIVAKLLGGELAVLEEYIWAWRGEGDTWYWYKQKDRSVLTSAFKSATPKVRVRSGKHSVALASMIDSHVPTRMMSRVHFQPIPYMYRYESAPLRPIDSASTIAFVGEYGQQGDVRQALRTLSFGSTPVAKLAKMVYLHVVCYGPPSNTEETKAAFRNLVAEHSFALLEYLAKALIQRSRDWAPILLDAGIADAITEVPEMKRQRTEQRAGSSGRTRTSPLATPSRTSPVAQLIRDTSSAMSTPQLKPVSLPESNTSVAQIICRGTYAEVMSLLETSSGGRPLHQGQLDALSDSLRKSSSAMAKVASALSTFLLRELQKASIEGRKRQLLDAVSDASTAFITICKSENAPAPQCASGHPLRIHFSTNWRCDKCHQHTGYGSLACRACNYDLCYQCAESSLRRFEVSATASAADLLRVWRERLRKAKRVSQVSEDEDEEEEVSDKTHHLLFTPQCVVPASGPIMSLKDRTIHSSTAFGKCDCGEVAPTLYAADLGGSGQQGSSHLVPFLLRLCGDVVLRDPGMLHALLEALESYGTHLFMEGVAGLPVFLREALSALGSHLPLTMKLDVARFLSIECRRYALYHVQEAGLFLRGAVQGEIDSNGLAHKITVTRGDEKAITAKLFDEFSCQSPSLRNKVEFHFDGEEGTGNGPSQELYSELSRTYAGMDCLWYQQEGARVACPTSSALYLKHFFVLGACLARSFIDGYVMEMEMLPQAWGFLRATTPEAVERATNELLRELEPTFMQSMEYLLKSSSEELSDMGLEDDQSKPLTTDTVKAYVNQQVQARLEVCLENLRSMALGVLTSLDLSVLWFLGSEELSMLLGGTRPETRDGKLFTEAELRAAVVEAHGYTAGSKEVEALISLVGGEFTRTMQTHFLEFLTGSARLPLNGLAGLGRKITVVKKDMEESKEQTLPSCNTCFLYFKLPPYSNKEVMRERLTLAITEGRKNFSLS